MITTNSFDENYAPKRTPTQMITTSSFDENYDNYQPYNHGWNSTVSPHEYHAHASSIERMPYVVTADFPPYQNVRMTFNNKSTYEDEAPHVMNRQLQNHHHAPQAHKKVHFVEQEKFVDRKNGKFVVHEESIDEEADGFITQKHKKFELSKWETFKGF